VILRWLEERREGVEQTEADIQAFVAGVVGGAVTRAPAAAWLSFVYLKGMTDRETALFTQAMTHSGDLLQWEGLEGPFVDKHSTGGVGDKVSLILAPVWAAMGFKVPMISGRGLGITGGTLDKLEAIPGYRTDLSPKELRGVLQEVGCFISGQTGELAPADRILYGLRNETATVPSIPLITGSILSKKLAEGLDQLVLDVKWGTGAFMKTRTEARKLADSLVRVGSLAQVQVEAHLTEMSQPLGCAVGNALEVEESIDCLRGQGPQDLRDLVLKLSGDSDKAAYVLDSGAAHRKFEAMVQAQGGDLNAPLKGQGCERWTLEAPESGVVRKCDALQIGQASFALGAGRPRAKDPVHHGVGVLVHAHVGDSVSRGQALATLVFADKGYDVARDHLKSAFVLES